MLAPSDRQPMHATTANRVFGIAAVGVMAFLTLVDLFAAQALLPSLATRYAVSPAAMGLAVNACTFGMAIAGLAVALFGRRIERRAGIVASLLVLAIPTALLAHAPNLWTFAALRICQGLCMASAFGLTLAYLGERFMADDATSAFAAYITGNVASNLFGRLIAAGVVDHAGLAGAFYTFAALNLLGAGLAWLTMSRVATADKTSMRPASAILDHVRDPRLRAAFGLGFCILFAFIGTFTFVNFVLVAPPFEIGMMGLGFVYFVFLPSIFTTLAAGNVARRIGMKTAVLIGLGVAAIGLPLIASSSLSAVLTGMVLVAAGTFFAQALATAFVSTMAKSDRAAAGGIYLASYFIGGLAGTALLGPVFDRLGWGATVCGIAVAIAIGAVLTLRMFQARTAGAAPATDAAKL